MLGTLLESNAPRPRRTGGTLASTLVHGTLIAAAIALTTRETVARPSPYTPRETPTIFRVQPSRPEPSDSRRPPTPSPREPLRRLPVIDHVPDAVTPPTVDLDVRIATDDEIAHGPIVSSSTLPGRPGGNGAQEGVLEERYVDRAPRILGTPPLPAFPTALRERGAGGRVSVQFVVDTLGRAEMTGLRVVESSDPLFAQSVRAVLPRYRFSPGEVGGQKVRTLVQLPFDFTLVR